MRKKIECMLLIVTFMICFYISPMQVLATDDSSMFFYVDSDISDEMVQYVSEKIDEFIYIHGLHDKYNDITVGKGISIRTDDSYDKALFPVWCEGKIIASFIVFENSYEECSGSISELFIDELNELRYLTTSNTPLFLKSSESGIYAVVDDMKYNLNDFDNDRTKVEDKYISNNIADATDTLDFDVYIQARIPTGYAKNFKIYEVQNGPCYAYALGNIFQNMGYMSYNANNILAYFNNSDKATINQLKNYVQSKNLTCRTGSGYMGFDGVRNAVYTKNSYILIGATKQGSPTVGHALVLFGFASTSSDQYYTVWNPWYNYTQTISASTRLISTEKATVFVWNNGYLYDIR